MSLRSRHRRLIVSFAFAFAIVGLGFWMTARRQATQRLARVSVCVLGDEPLQAGELASERFLAIELARPRERMKIVVWGTDERFAPERPLTVEERWPDRCATYVREAARGPISWVLSSRLRDGLRELADELLNRERRMPPSHLDDVWSAKDSPVASLGVKDVVANDHAKDLPRPWAPVIFVPRPLPSLSFESKNDLQQACPAISMLASLDHWDDEAIVLSGVPGCVVGRSPTSGLRFGQLRLAAPNEKPANADTLLGGGKAMIRGSLLSISDEDRTGRLYVGSEVMPVRVREGDDGGAPKPSPIDIGPVSSFKTCRSGETRALLLENQDHSAFDVRFLDASGLSDAAHASIVAPEFPGHGKWKVTHSDLTMSCRGKEAHVAWAWSTEIAQRVTHEIVVATCTPGHCSMQSAQVHIETPRGSNCGFCALDLEQGSAASPMAIDLFGAVALVWTAFHTARARLGPLDQLETARELILWSSQYDPSSHVGNDNGERVYWDSPRVITRGDVALVGMGQTTISERDVAGAGVAKSRIFRLDAHAATELRPSR